MRYISTDPLYYILYYTRGRYFWHGFSLTLVLSGKKKLSKCSWYIFAWAVSGAYHSTVRSLYLVWSSIKLFPRKILLAWVFLDTTAPRWNMQSTPKCISVTCQFAISRAYNFRCQIAVPRRSAGTCNFNFALPIKPPDIISKAIWRLWRQLWKSHLVSAERRLQTKRFTK